MSLLVQKALLQVRSTVLTSKRFRGKINIQRPKAPHYERARVLNVVQPIFSDKTKGIPMIDLCTKRINKIKKIEQINPLENIIAKECLNWFNHSKMIALFHVNPFSAEDKFKANIALKKHNMYLKAYGKTILGLAVKDTNYEAVLQLFNSQNMIIFSTENDVARMLKIIKKIPQLVLMAGIVEGRLLSRSELVSYSTMPDIQIMRSQVVQTLFSAQQALASHLTHHQRSLVSSLNQHIDLNSQPKEVKVAEDNATSPDVDTKKE